MNNIIHRDIKPENLVLDEKGYVRITDFGVAKKNLRDNSSETSGTPGYMAPEVLCALNHSFPADFFALGVIIFEFMNGYRPYLGRNRKEIKEAVLARQIHVHRKQLFENGWSFESGDLINKLLYRKPHKRLGCNGIKEIKEHPWFKNINWDELFEKKMESPFIPKEGDNFDKRYCEGIEQIDTQTKERYEYYKSKSKFKTLFQNYTFVREEDKQEYHTSSKNPIVNKSISIKKTKNLQNPISSSTTNISNNIVSKSTNDLRFKGHNKNSNSMTNIHSFSIVKDENKPEKNYANNSNKNNNVNKLLNENYNYNYNEEVNLEEVNIEEGIGEEEEANHNNKKLFYSTFKIPDKLSNINNNNKFLSDSININNNENVGGGDDTTKEFDFSKKLEELKVFINKKEDKSINNNSKSNINLNDNKSFGYYTKDKTFRSSSSINKRKDYYSVNSKNIENKMNDGGTNNKYYQNAKNNNSNNKSYSSMKINKNTPININKYNRSSSQNNIFYETKGIKNNMGKMIKYINLEDEMIDKSNIKVIHEPKSNTRNSNKSRYKNNSASSGNILVNHSQFVYYPLHKSNNAVGGGIKKRYNQYSSPINVGIGQNNNNNNKIGNEEYLMYKTSRYFNQRNKNLKSDNYLYFDNDNINMNPNKINHINNINNNNININFNINNINNNINNINHIGVNDYNKMNISNNKIKNISKLTGDTAITSYHNSKISSQRKYIYSNNSSNNNKTNTNNNKNLIAVKSLLYDDQQSKKNVINHNRYSNKNNMIIECDDYESSKFPKNNNISSGKKNKLLPKTSSMKSFNFNSHNYIEKYLEQKERNNKNLAKPKKSNNNNNNFEYNFEILSPNLNNNVFVEDNCCKNNRKNNTLFRKQKAQPVNSRQNDVHQMNKYSIFKK